MTLLITQMVQSGVSEPQRLQERASLSKRPRTLKPLNCAEGASYHQKSRQGPQNLGPEEPSTLKQEMYKEVIMPSLRVNLAYMLLKYIDADNCRVPGWTGFYTVFDEFRFITWKEASFKTIQREITLYITHGEECHCLHVNSGLINVRPVENLFCDHEESDTRMFLHALHASQTCNHVIIKSPDTDVAILGVCLSEHFTVNFLTGVGNKTRILDLKKVASHLGQSICSSLIGLHIFTGCDSTSAFYGKGKKKPFDLACKHEAFLSAFKDLGTSLDRRESTMKALEKFVCHMYGQYKANDVNDARYKVFCLGTTTPLEKTIPPCCNALKEHSKRVNYQAAIWKRALQIKKNVYAFPRGSWLAHGEL